MRLTFLDAGHCRASLLLAAAMLVPTLAARAPKTARPALATLAVVKGSVGDARGRPVAQAIVSVQSRAATATTDAAGRFILRLTRTRDGELVTMLVAHRDLVAQRVTVALSRDTVQVQVVLQGGAVAMTGASADHRVIDAHPASPGPVFEHAMRTETSAMRLRGTAAGRPWRHMITSRRTHSDPRSSRRCRRSRWTSIVRRTRTCAAS